MKRIEKVYETLNQLCIKQYDENGVISGVSANTIADLLILQRTNTSSDLNKLYLEGRIEKIEGKPVLYRINSFIESATVDSDCGEDIFEEIIGAELSLRNTVQQARAAIIYPPNGLHTIILGETGTGKSMIAEIMYKYAKDIGKIKSNSAFVSFNCADYANNPQLLMAQLFGVIKGAYTGADKDRQGLVEKANEGVLFLDEVHRLPPEGQEMLFYLMDKGIYRRLGETQVQHKVKLLIICATTENVDSTLLKTFTRRIPMIIKLPALKERTIEEKYKLIKKSFRVEATCIKSDISVTANALKALLLYDCPNNIGQLESDIKLCCAKAFLEKMMKRDKSLCVHSEDLPEYVLRGVFKYKEHKEEIDKFIGKDVIKFTVDGSNISEVESTKVFNFYDALEDKRKLLKSKGLDEKNVKLIMSLDIETYLKKYILNIDHENLEELYKVADRKIVNIVEEFLRSAGEKLHKVFSQRILYGLSMHIASTIERINSGKKIENHQLEEVKRLHSEEFEISNELLEKVQSALGIKLPEDETGFISMFLCMDDEAECEEGKVGVLVAMHGESAATSIADVANRLLGETHVVGYNMPLDQKPETALENIMEIVYAINKGKGIILLVDMGSLLFFADMIYERTKIPVKSVEMVSTPMVLEAARKALMNSSVEEVYEACIGLSPYIGRIYKDSLKFDHDIKKDVILTACITGQGTAVKLKSILEQRLDISSKDIDIISIEIADMTQFRRNIEMIKEQKNVLAVVSAINPRRDDIIYVSISEIFEENKLLRFSEILDLLQVINNMEKVINENVNINSQKYVESFKKFFVYLYNQGINISENVLLGLIIHLACAIEKTLKGEEVKHTRERKGLLEEHFDKVNLIKNSLKFFESAFNMNFSNEEYIDVMKTLYFL